MELFRKYGVETTIYFPLITVDSQDFKGTPTLAAGDSVISKDGGNVASTTNTMAETEAGEKIVSLVITATEMEAKVIIIRIVDAAGAEWEDQMVLIHTYGHASAGMPFDLSTALQSLHADYDAAKTAASAANLAIVAAYLDTEIQSIIGATAGKVIVSADGLTVEKYNADGTLFVTLVRTGTGPYTWTPTWA